MRLRRSVHSVRTGLTAFALACDITSDQSSSCSSLFSNKPDDDLVGGDVVGRGQAGNPGSDGASPYPQLRPPAPGLPAPCNPRTPNASRLSSDRCACDAVSPFGPVAGRFERCAGLQEA